MHVISQVFFFSFSYLRTHRRGLFFTGRTARPSSANLASFQSLQISLVEMRTAQVAMRVFVEHALQVLATGGPEQVASMAN